MSSSPQDPAALLAAAKIALAPGGAAGLVNLPARLAAPHFDADLCQNAVQCAEARLKEQDVMGELARPLNDLERFALAVLLRAAEGQR